VALYCDLVTKAVIEGISQSQSASGVDLGAAEQPVEEAIAASA
jgi:small subunit ribosomal protein S2